MRLVYSVGAGSSTCQRVLAALCGHGARQHSSTDSCLVCTGHHQHALSTAGCVSADASSYCEGGVRAAATSPSRAQAARLLEVRYDNGSGARGAVAIHATAAVSSSPSSWRDVRVNVTDAAFVRGGVGGADVWVTNVGREAVEIHMVEVAHV